jgi:hypothetical protein
MDAWFDARRSWPAESRDGPGACLASPRMAPPQPTLRKRVRTGIETVFAERLSPERTRRATWFERQTVGRLEWDTIARFNRWLELLGRIATFVWVAIIATIVLGVNLRDEVESVLNSGRPLRYVAILTLVLPTVVFFLLHSVVGFLRWRLQRELWRRDVDRFEAGMAEREVTPRR